jgi:ferredoxin
VRELRVDRIACTGHGVCASVLPGAIRLDPWGYPIVDDAWTDPDDGAVAIRMCPAQALYWAGR